MSTDRELLEDAAKAAGIPLQWPRDPISRAVFDGVPPRRTDTWENWNPLTDDADAFRLAVALDITVIPGHSSEPYSVAQWWRPPTLIALDFERVLVEGDRAAATRRAIVRAAAALGSKG